MAAVHNGVALDREHGVSLSCPVIDEQGRLFVEHCEDSAFYEAVQDAGLDLYDVLQAIDLGQNELVFSPIEENRSGEMAVYFVDHGERIPRGPVDPDLTVTEIFLTLIAGEVLARDLLSTYDLPENEE